LICKDRTYRLSFCQEDLEYRAEESRQEADCSGQERNDAEKGRNGDAAKKAKDRGQKTAEPKLRQWTLKGQWSIYGRGILRVKM